jgi:hypothetical protein
VPIQRLLQPVFRNKHVSLLWLPELQLQHGDPWFVHRNKPGNSGSFITESKSVVHFSTPAISASFLSFASFRPTKTGSGHNKFRVIYFYSSLFDNGYNRAHQVLIGTHPAGYAVHNYSYFMVHILNISPIHPRPFPKREGS